MESNDNEGNIITIRGFPVYFPKGRKPFASQLALMSKFLVGVQKRENCLLESPTGTGKTMALLCAALAWQRRQNEDGDMLTESESDTESEEGVGRPVINAEDEEILPSFDDFQYAGPKDIDPAARSKHGREGKAVVELSYEETGGSKGEVSATGHVKHRLLSDDDDNVFESPKKKRTKSSSYVATLTDGKMCPNEDMRKNIDTTADGTYTEALSVTSDTPSNAIRKGHSTMKSPPASKPSAEGEPPIVKKKGERWKRRTKKKRKRPRRVYFCSRTHSQLTQVVAELRKCVEACPGASAVHIGEHGKGFRMSLLASRKSTCINKTVCNDPMGVDDACKRLLKENACPHYRRAKYAPTKMPPVWDVEEAVRTGKKNGTCAYQTTRDALLTADIVLGPYNYLVDPSVREVMGIKLKDAVVIFDEAHNLEDVAREAASAKLSLRALANAADEMQRLGSKCPLLAPAYTSLRRVIVGVQTFLEEKEATLPLETYETAHKVFNGTEVLGLMQSRAGVTCDSLGELKDALHKVASEEATDDSYTRDLEANSFTQEPGGGVLSSGALQLTSSLIKVLGFLLAEGMENVEHYKMVVLRERAQWQPAITAQGSGRGRRRRSPGPDGVVGGYGTGGSMETYLCFWCLSASVCFSEIDKQVHSTVLTSGTLSPLDSFAGELGIDFPHRLEAPHVINVAKQCLVTSVGLSRGIPLDARYDNRNALGYQDAVGETLLQYARVVPGGMLAFFPSYGLLDKTYNRWKATGFLQALEATKAVFLEPKGRGKISGVLTDFYEATKGSSQEGDFETDLQKRSPSPSRQGGALMLAVARGKVSEGIDFSDDAARMCVIIGIPYPSAGDLQVKLKKEYQDQRRRKDPQLVDGRAWYNLQAFRAVNQAVGRCIRHRSDFGAIVLCDLRYSSQPAATASLSKWVRSSVKQTQTVEASLPLVQEFFQNHLRQEHLIGPGGKLPTKSWVEPLQERRCNSTGVGTVSLSRTGSFHESEGKKLKEEKQRANHLKTVFVQSPAEARAKGGSSLPVRQKNGVAGSRNQGIDIRRALGTVNASATEANVVSQSNAIIPAVRAPVQRDRGFYCRNPECSAAALVSEPVGDLSEPSRSRPRRVAVTEGHLWRVGAATVAGDALAGDDLAASALTGADSRHSYILLEAPKSWVLGEHVFEGDGRWVAGDEMVYAPLFCPCTGCRNTQIGEKALAAGQGGYQLIGRAWFFTSRVQSEGFTESSSPEQLLVPAQVAKNAKNASKEATTPTTPRK